MGEETAISWADKTFNIWIGCTHADADPPDVVAETIAAGSLVVATSPECQRCYAEAWDARNLHGDGTHWGPGSPRRFLSEDYWRKPLRWNRDAEAKGVRYRVFCSSLADVFERHIDPAVAARMAQERRRLWDLIRRTPNLDWLLLTKRPENFAAMLPWTGSPDHDRTGMAPDGPPWLNVWLGVTCGVPRSLWRVDMLRATPAAVRFISCEPLLEEITAAQWDRALEFTDGGDLPPHPIHQLIVGDESTPGQRGARPAAIEWVRTARDAAERHGVAFHFKQWCGADHPAIEHDLGERKGRKIHLPILDGKRWDGVPR